jgi:hypothetical protein
MQDPDLRILALVNPKLLPPAVQDPFDHWRIWKARDAVANAVRKRMGHAEVASSVLLQVYLERLEVADTEQTIFEGIYALAEVVETYRKQLGLHSQYVVLIMSSHLNPYGLLEFQQDFSQPAASVIAAAQELWRLAREHQFDVVAAIKQIINDQTLIALNTYYESQPNG